MRIAFALLLLVHGLIHGLGFAKPFGLGKSQEIHAKITPAGGVVWLVAGLLFLAGAGALFALPEWWWAITLPAVVLSEVAIVGAWSDAKLGTLVNVLVLLPSLVGLIDAAPSGLRASYTAAVQARQLSGPEGAPITEADLAQVPPLVQKYLRFAGVLGTAPVRSFHARFRGEIRSAPDSDWMSFTADQHNYFEPPARLFLIDASRFGVPFVGLHSFTGAGATMKVRVLSLLTVVDGSGPEMNKSETVTMLNDMCLLAPATLLSPNVRFEEAGAHTVKAHLTHAGNTVSALLFFDDTGALINFVSDDRYQSADGKVFKAYRWSTPVHGYRDYQGRKLAEFGEASWRMPDGELSYGRFQLLEVHYNGQGPPR